jgi:glycine/serine hydroxymethyltransferase
MKDGNIPTGIRLGTAAMNTRGLKEEELKKIYKSNKL